MESNKTIEQKVSEAILQKAQDVTIGDTTYKVAPPSTATLILASEVVSRLPHELLDEKNIIGESLSIAKECRELGDLAATLIIGAKDINRKIERQQKRRVRLLWGLLTITKTETIWETEKDILARRLLEEMTPRELHSLVATLMASMQVGDFFGLTTFLTEINLIRPTKVVTEATASGQP